MSYLSMALSIVSMHEKKLILYKWKSNKKNNRDLQHDQMLT